MGTHEDELELIQIEETKAHIDLLKLEVERAKAALRGDAVSRLAYLTGEDPDDLR